jgi:hypothetical protein
MTATHYALMLSAVKARAALCGFCQGLFVKPYIRRNFFRMHSESWSETADQSWLGLLRRDRFIGRLRRFDCWR